MNLLCNWNSIQRTPFKTWSPVWLQSTLPFWLIALKAAYLRCQSQVQLSAGKDDTGKGGLTLYFSQSCQLLTLIMSWQLRIHLLPTLRPRSVQQVLPYHFSLLIHLVIYTTCSELIGWLFERGSDITLVSTSAEMRCTHRWKQPSNTYFWSVVCMLLLLSLFICLGLVVWWLCYDCFICFCFFIWWMCVCVCGREGVWWFFFWDICTKCSLC